MQRERERERERERVILKGALLVKGSFTRGRKNCKIPKRIIRQEAGVKTLKD